MTVKTRANLTYTSPDNLQQFSFLEPGLTWSNSTRRRIKNSEAAAAAAEVVVVVAKATEVVVTRALLPLLLLLLVMLYSTCIQHIASTAAAVPRSRTVFQGWLAMLRGHSSLCLPASKRRPLKSHSIHRHGKHY